MLYPCSPSLYSLPVPGIGFCQSILFDRGTLDQQRRGPISSNRTLQEAVDVAAINHLVK